MLNNFSVDDWTKSFILIFKTLSERGWIKKKKKFAEEIGLPTQSILNLILNEKRDFPLGRRQHACVVLRDKYHVNLYYLLDRSKSMFTRDIETLPPENDSNQLSYQEILHYNQLKNENEMLKKTLADKEEIIKTQATLIEVLKSKNVTTK